MASGPKRSYALIGSTSLAAIRIAAARREAELRELERQ